MIMISNEHRDCNTAELAQSVERTTLNRVVVGSIPTFGANLFVMLSVSLGIRNTRCYPFGDAFRITWNPKFSF